MTAMPEDLAISVAAKPGTDVLLSADQGERKHPNWRNLSTIDRAYAPNVRWMGNEADGYLVSVRWSALGTHRGHGVYGAPTGRRVALWGISQHRIEQGRIAQEWTLFNEFEVLQQILRDEPVAGAA